MAGLLNAQPDPGAKYTGAQQGLLGTNQDQSGQVAQPAPALATSYSPTTTDATADKAQASSWTATNAGAVKALANGYTAAKTDVTPEATSAYQLAKITGENSPLVQQSTASGLQMANKRGLLNSSIAVGAVQDAVLKNATPLAINDANTYSRANEQTAAAENTSREFGANAGNVAELKNADLGTGVNTFNASEVNKAAADKAASETQVSGTNAQLGTNVNLANSGAQNDASRLDAQLKTGVSTTNAGAVNAASLADKQLASQQLLAQADNAMKERLANIQASTTLSATDKQAAVQKAIADGNNATNLTISGNDNATKQLLQGMDAASKLSLTQIDATTKLAVANLDAKTKTDLSKLESDNRELLQTNISASSMYQQYVTNLANISLNDKMDGAAKAQAMKNQLAAFNAGLQAIGSVSGLDLSKYFQDSTLDTTSTTPAVPDVGPIRIPM